MNTETTPQPKGIEAVAESEWPELVRRIREGDPAGMEEFYRVISKGIRFHLYRQLGPQDLDDRVHDIFLIITQAIQKGELREPERLMGYVWTILRRQIAAHIDQAVSTRRQAAPLDSIAPLRDRDPSPERLMIDRQNHDLAYRVLQSLRQREREVLVRFYLREERPEQICREMRLTATQFRLIKSRAKARFSELGKNRMSLRRGFLQSK